MEERLREGGGEEVRGEGGGERWGREVGERGGRERWGRGAYHSKSASTTRRVGLLMAGSVVSIILLQ